MVKILTIDDIHENLIVANALLEEAFPEAQLLTASNGKQGIKLCFSEKPDVILLDIMMPGMNGYEVCKKMKADEDLKRIPVIMITATRIDKEGKIKALEAGADAFLTAPLDASELTAQIRAMLRIKEAEERKLNEKRQLESLVYERTKALEKELAEHKHTEDALRKSEQTISNLISNLPGFVYQCKNDKNRTMVYLSNGCLSITGYSPAELLNNKLRPYNDVIHSDYRDLLWDKWQHCLSLKTPLEEVYQITHKGGAIRWVWERGQGVFSDKNELLYLEGFIQDITSSKNAEEALKESEDKFRTLAESAPFAIMIYQDDYWVYINQAGEKICGYTNEEISKMHFWDFIEDDFKEIVKQKGKRRQKGKEEDASYEFKIITKENLQKWVFITSSSIIYRGRPAGILSLADITERKYADEIQKVIFAISNAVIVTKDLKELVLFIREQLSSLIDTTNFSVTLYDEGSSMLSSPFSENEKDIITSWPLEKSLTGYVIKQNRSMLLTKQQIHELEKLGEVEPIETICEIWLGVPLNIDEKVIGAFVVQSYNDPSAFTEKNLEMLDFISHQISISIQRKQYIENLRIALSKAEESDRLKTAFLSNMSHEIRTPMNGILGFSDLLDDESLSYEERKQYTRIINNNGKHLLSIINDIIDIAKIDSNQLAINYDWLNLNYLLDDLLVSYNNEKIVYQKENITFILNKEFENYHSLILTDEVRLRQILLNLLGNALKFTKKGFIKFGYLLQNDQLCFFVQDTGKGIPKEKQSIIFERFRQEEETYTRQFGGTGLGLTISKGLVELLGGKLWLNSDEGKGTTFFFTIPYNKPDADALSFDSY